MVLQFHCKTSVCTEVFAHILGGEFGKHKFLALDSDCFYRFRWVLNYVVKKHPFFQVFQLSKISRKSQKFMNFCFFLFSSSFKIFWKNRGDWPSTFWSYPNIAIVMLLIWKTCIVKRTSDCLEYKFPLFVLFNVLKALKFFELGTTSKLILIATGGGGPVRAVTFQSKNWLDFASATPDVAQSTSLETTLLQINSPRNYNYTHNSWICQMRIWMSLRIVPDFFYW